MTTADITMGACIDASRPDSCQGGTMMATPSIDIAHERPAFTDGTEAAGAG